MAIDPIYGMTVDEASTPRVEHDGQTFFCGDHCWQEVTGVRSAISNYFPDDGGAVPAHCHAKCNEDGAAWLVRR